MLRNLEILDERSREMLALLIKTHIATGEPVGSRIISRYTREGLSPATVRNIIADLIEGLLRRRVRDYALTERNRAGMIS